MSRLVTLHHATSSYVTLRHATSLCCSFHSFPFLTLLSYWLMTVFLKNRIHIGSSFKSRFIISSRAFGEFNSVLLTPSPRLRQISALQDTPELLGFLRNTSSPPTRHKRAVSTDQSYSGKTLVSHTCMYCTSSPENQMFISGSQMFEVFILLSLVQPSSHAELH